MTEARVHPAWTRQTPFVSVTLPQPAMVRKYFGGQTLELDEQAQAWLSESTLETIVRAGVNLVYASFFNGFGLEYEKKDMENVREFITRAHARNLKVAAVVNCGWLTPETLLQEEPDCRNWLAITQEGHAAGCIRQGAFTRPCYNSENYTRYLERVCNLAVDYGADSVQFAELGGSPEPDSCRCPICVAAFREFLRTRYGAHDERTRAAGLARFGHHNFTHVRPPVTDSATPAALETPHAQEWLCFKTHTLSQCLQRLLGAIAKRKPECAVGADLLTDIGGNPQWRRGISVEAQLPLLDCVRLSGALGSFHLDDRDAREQENEPRSRTARRLRLADAGQLELFANSAAESNSPERAGTPKESAQSELRAEPLALVSALKIARAFGVSFDDACSLEDRRTALALKLAFNGAVGSLGVYDEQLGAAQTQAFVTFAAQHQSELQDGSPLSPLALFCDRPSLAFDVEATRALNALSKLLLERNLPFELLYSTQLEAPQSQTIILPNCSCLSDELAEKFERFVDQGGGLVVLSQTGLRDPWRRVRRGRVLASLLGEEGQALQREHGKGRVAFLPQATRGGEIIEAIRFALGSALPYSVEAQSGTVLSSCVRAGDGALLLQVVALGQEPARGVRCSVLCAAAPQQVVPLSPCQSFEPLSFDADNGRLFFGLPTLDKYVLFKIVF